MTKFSKNPKPNNFVHPNKIKRIKQISYGTDSKFISILNELCDDSTLQLIYINQISPYIKINSQNREYSLELLKDNYAFNNAFYISLGYREQSIKWLKIQKNLALEILKNL